MRFEKISFEQYEEDFQGDELHTSAIDCNIFDIYSGHIQMSSGFDSLRKDTVAEIYRDIKLPQRATEKSAGYDFFAPYDFVLHPGSTIKIATGIRVILDDDKFLMCAPRSGHGFKARIQLDNTIGIIDADYSNSDNEGHIHLKLTNDSHTGKSIAVKKGEGMMQAIILSYYTVEDDNVTIKRNGGFGSTDQNSKEDI